MSWSDVVSVRWVGTGDAEWAAQIVRLLLLLGLGQLHAAAPDHLTDEEHAVAQQVFLTQVLPQSTDTQSHV